MADRLKMTVCEAKSKLTVSEFLGWLEYIAEENERKKEQEDYPSTSDWYVIQLTQWVAGIATSFGGEKPPTSEDLILSFVEKSEEVETGPLTEEQLAARIARSKAFWSVVADGVQETV